MWNLLATQQTQYLFNTYVTIMTEHYCLVSYTIKQLGLVCCDHNVCFSLYKQVYDALQLTTL